MEQFLIELVSKWLLKAENDIKTIQCLLENDPITDSICFHAQQAAEKYLKAYLVSQEQTLPKTHDINTLLKQCIVIDKDFLNLSNAVILTDYAVELRYPDDYYIPDLEEAIEAITIAKNIKTLVLSKINIIMQ